MKLRRCLGFCVTRASNAPTMNDTLNRISFKQHFILHISRVVHVKSSKRKFGGSRTWKHLPQLSCRRKGLMNRYLTKPGEFSVSLSERDKAFKKIITFRFVLGNFPWQPPLNEISRATLVGWVDKMSFTKRRFNPKNLCQKIPLTSRFRHQRRQGHRTCSVNSPNSCFFNYTTSFLDSFLNSEKKIIDNLSSKRDLKFLLDENPMN